MQFYTMFVTQNSHYLSIFKSTVGIQFSGLEKFKDIKNKPKKILHAAWDATKTKTYLLLHHLLQFQITTYRTAHNTWKRSMVMTALVNTFDMILAIHPVQA